MESRRASRILVLGANGPTGRQVVEQGLSRGLQVEALTRHPEDFPIRHERLRVVPGDAKDAATVDTAVAACDVVVSVIGAAYTRQPVDVYSASVRLVIDAMGRHGQRRLLAVTSSGVIPTGRRADLGRFGRALHWVARKTYGRTVYDDMVLMEAAVSASGLDWTIVRPPGLTDEAGTGYATAENFIEGSFCARADLAAMLLDQLDDPRYLQRVAAVTTPGLEVSVVKTIRRELFKR